MKSQVLFSLNKVTKKEEKKIKLSAAIVIGTFKS